MARLLLLLALALQPAGAKLVCKHIALSAQGLTPQTQPPSNRFAVCKADCIKQGLSDKPLCRTSCKDTISLGCEKVKCDDASAAFMDPKCCVCAKDVKGKPTGQGTNGDVPYKDSCPLGYLQCHSKQFTSLAGAKPVDVDGSWQHPGGDSACPKSAYADFQNAYGGGYGATTGKKCCCSTAPLDPNAADKCGGDLFCDTDSGLLWTFLVFFLIGVGRCIYITCLESKEEREERMSHNTMEDLGFNTKSSARPDRPGGGLYGY